jgi:hypothetical protein
VARASFSRVECYATSSIHSEGQWHETRCLERNARLPRERYPTDLTDEQWALIKPFLQRSSGGEGVSEAELREIVNAILWKAAGTVPWEYLPHDFPDWTTVRYYFEKWARDKTWERLHAALSQRLSHE